MLTDWLLVGLGVLLTAGTAVFVAAEFSLVTLDPGLVEQQTPEDDTRGRSVLRALRHLSTQLSGAQVGITITTVLLGYTTQPAVVRLLGVPLEAAGVAGAAVTAIAAVVGLVLVNGFSMLFGELVPKNFAISRPLGTARLVAPLQAGFTSALRPVIAATNGTANTILRRVGVEPREELSGARSPAELASLVRRSAEQGTLDAATATLLTNSIDFSTLTAVDVMTDRTRLVVVRRDDSAADVMALSRQTGHSRFPVIGDSVDDVVGFVHLRKAMAVPHDRRAEVPAAALMVDAPRVPETVGLGPLLVDLRGQGLQMAVVVDEYGGTSGAVTLEDVVEELVGEVADEHDRTRSSLARQGDGSWVLPGVLRPDELHEATGLRVADDGPWETVGGLLMARLGRIPVEGDEVVEGHVRLVVERMDGRRVERVRVSDLTDDATQEA
ncbi:MAG: HlyC/CorC family transporter [Cellulomonas iranensis]|uniref:CBS domain containing-hemolysin-like protein n=1 Tax=Cellulomonas iranensis TaxID=76862 RepID=A0ABU0GG71_9CELL|nr:MULTISPECIES: hemolysin family protein [Cellulomonas]MBO9567541.1 HlyC/CorC family transporter [Cellulomonas iranensis]MDQ0424088.1 CBS domain containing-hemolysin-like protein [Cellulomonas iranensis]UCN13647.1 hemolysin family protein [Cellulomonas iranensis]